MLDTGRAYKPEKLGAGSIRGYHPQMCVSYDFLVRRRASNEFLTADKVWSLIKPGDGPFFNSIRLRAGSSMYSSTNYLRKGSLGQKKHHGHIYKLNITGFPNTCREVITVGGYGAATAVKNLLEPHDLIPVCSPTVIIEGKPVFTNAEFQIDRQYGENSLPNEMSPLTNLFVGLAYIMLMRGVSSEEQRLKTLKPASKNYGSGSDLKFPVMSGVVTVVPPVFYSFIGTLFRVAFNVVVSPYRVRALKTLLKIGQTSPEELVKVINSFDVNRAEEIFSKAYPYIKYIAFKAGANPFEGSRQSEILKILKYGLKNTVKRPVIAGSYAKVGKYGMGINKMLSQKESTWKLKTAK